MFANIPLCHSIGSDEEYIKDFTHRRREEGSTVVVLIARGLMKTPVIGTLSNAVYLYICVYFESVQIDGLCIYILTFFEKMTRSCLLF